MKYARAGRIPVALLMAAWAGWATIVVTGGGAQAAGPQWTRLAGSDRMATAIAIAHVEYPGGPSSHTALITSAANANLIDSVTAAPLATALQAPILLSQNAQTLGPETSEYLTTHNISQVYLIGADANSVLEAQLPPNISAVMVSGPDRYTTAAAIAGALQRVTGNGSFSTLYVASAANDGLTDALAVAPWAAAAGEPILLAAPNQSTLPASEAPFVSGQPSQTAVVVGTATGFGLTLTGDTVQTIGHPSASSFANAVAVAQAFAPPSGYPIVDMANGGDGGEHLVDAITGAPLAASQHAPILFTDGNRLPASVQAFLAGPLTRGTTTIEVFGGSASISDQTTTQVVQDLTGGAGGQTTQVRVAANVPWVATGISVQPGEVISLQASGTINDGSIYPQNATSGPQGLGIVSSDGYSCTSNVHNPQPTPYLVAGVPCESLVGFIGQAPPQAPASPSTAVFEVGSSDTLTVQTSGSLYLSVNDNYFPDNSGSFLVTITVIPSNSAVGPYTYSGSFQGQSVTLTAVPNVTVEQLPDATLIGQLADFQTNDPKFACLDGESLNVWSAPKEFPGVDVVHNGDQGSQCTYGTWTFAPLNAAVGPYTYSGSFQGQSVTLTAVPNVTVEQLPDATLIGQLVGFQTNDPKFACLDGESLNVWSAPKEFPGVDVVHNGDQGSQCTYGTWTFLPIGSGAPSPSPISLTVTATPNPVDTDQPVTVTATLSQPVNDGTISITIAGTSGTGFSCTPKAGTCTPNQQWANTAYGVYPIVAYWSGDSTYGPTSASAWVTVGGGATAPYTLSIDAGVLQQPTLVANGSTSIPLSITVTGANGQPVPNDTVLVTASCGEVGPGTVTTNDQGMATVNYTVCSTPGTVKIHAKELLSGAPGVLTIALTPNPAWVCAASNCYWGFGWGSAQTETPFEEAQGQLWNPSPCLGVCVGSSQADLNNGVTMDAAFVAGISGQGVRDWLVGTYVAPCLQAGGCSNNSTDNVTLRLHMDTIVVSNAAGVLSSVSASGVMADYQAWLTPIQQKPLGWNVSVTCDAALGADTGAQVAEDLNAGTSSALQDAEDLALPVLQNALQNASQTVIAQAQSESWAGAKQNLDNLLTTIAGGSSFYSTSWSTQMSVPTGQDVTFSATPEVDAVTAGLGGAGALVVSFVQAEVTAQSVSYTALTQGHLAHVQREVPTAVAWSRRRE